MPAPIAPIVLAASALGFGLWWFWPAQKTGVTPGGGGGGGGDTKKPPTAEQTAAAKVKGAADGCLRGTADAKAGKTPAQASLDLNVGGKDHDALVAAEQASGDPDAYWLAYATAHKTCFDAASVTKTMPVPAPTTYKVGPGETPTSIASKFGITVDYLLSGLNGYGHGSDGTKDNAPFPYGGDMHAFTGTFSGLGTAPYPAKGTTFTPTWQAGHKATANLHPIFRSSTPGAGGQWYWWFPLGATPDAVPLPYSPNDPGFGRIYSDGGLFLVGPWYSGMTLTVPGKPGDDAGTGALLVDRPQRASSRSSLATGPRIGNMAIVGARRAPVDVDQMHAGMARHFSPQPNRLGWPAPPDEVDDGTSTLYRSY